MDLLDVFGDGDEVTVLTPDVLVNALSSAMERKSMSTAETQHSAIRYLGINSGALALVCMVWAMPAFADAGRGAAVLCYLWADQASPTLNTPYTPDTLYSFNAKSGSEGISVTKTGTGTYSVTCSGVGGSTAWGAGGHVQVSAYGDGVATFCHVGSWATGVADFTASVDCFGKGFVPTDSQFDLLFLW